MDGDLLWDAEDNRVLESLGIFNLFELIIIIIKMTE